LREETRKRLERALWRERAKKAGLALAGLGALAGVFMYENLDASVKDVRVAGTVEHVGPLNARSTKAVAEGLSVDVKLDDGRHVQVLALKSHGPHVGDRIEVTEHRHATGRVTHTWK